jgi:RHS repeat-associated protein
MTRITHRYDDVPHWSPRITGKERDSETGLDYFGARYYASTTGRFMTPDPVGIMKQKLRDPQQWNMYAYARNNPLRFMDPTGMYVANCGSDVKNCDKQIQNFDNAVKNALKSKIRTL